MSVPETIRESLRAKLWTLADKWDWLRLSPVVKSQRYESWAKDPEIGGVLSRYMAIPKVRLYLKDSLLKDYARAKSRDGSRLLQVLGIQVSDAITTYAKPHGVKLPDGSIVCWGQAGAWKDLLMAAYERGYGGNLTAKHAVVLTHALGHYKQESIRKFVEDAAGRLGVKKVVWLET
jgi:hypothetical protein